MGTRNGWICIFRKLPEWEWYKTPNMVQLFVHLLISANHKDGAWQGIKVQKGQLITGRKALSEATGLSEMSIRTCLARLEQTGEIRKQTTSKFSIITICNYSEYQDKKEDTNQQITNEQPASNQQLTTNNKKNNITKEKNMAASLDCAPQQQKKTAPKRETALKNGTLLSFNQFWNEYPKKINKQATEKLWAKLNPSPELLQVILSQLKKLKNTKNWQDNNGQFIPHPSTWVTNQRWTDEVISEVSEWQ
jgi:DNA-binding transcriptional regulator PaaX